MFDNKLQEIFNDYQNYSAELYAKTKKYQKIYGFELGEGAKDTWNNEADAFKHTFGSAELALKYTTGISRAIGLYLVEGW